MGTDRPYSGLALHHHLRRRDPASGGAVPPVLDDALCIGGVGADNRIALPETVA